ATADTLAQAPLYIVEAAGYSGLIVISLLLLWQSDDIARILPALGRYGFAAYRLLPAAQVVYRSLAKLRFSSSVLDKLSSDLQPSERAKQDEIRPFKPQQEIRMTGVRYCYPSAPDRPILDGLDVVIPVN